MYSILPLVRNYNPSTVPEGRCSSKSKISSVMHDHAVVQVTCLRLPIAYNRSRAGTIKENSSGDPYTAGIIVVRVIVQLVRDLRYDPWA